MTKTNFNNKSNTYNQYSFLQDIVINKLISYSKEFIKKDHIIADIGSGTGNLKKRIDYNNIEYKKIIEIDNAYNMCLYSSNDNVINADCLNLPILSNSIDIVYSSLCIQWVDNKKHAIDEFIRIVKTGGYIIFSLVLDNSLNNLEHIYKRNDLSFNKLKLPLHSEIIRLFDNKEIDIVIDEIIYHEIKHNSVIDLLKSIKNIGASNPIKSSKIITRNKFEKIDQDYYHNFGNYNSDWEILYFIGKKI